MTQTPNDIPVFNVGDTVLIRESNSHGLVVMREESMFGNYHVYKVEMPTEDGPPWYVFFTTDELDYLEVTNE